MFISRFNKFPRDIAAQKLTPKEIQRSKARAIEAARLREEGHSWAEISDTLGYAGAGSAYNAVMTRKT